MKAIYRVVTVVLVAALLLPHAAAAQAPPDVWRSFAEKIDVGTELNVRLREGARFRAVLVGVREDALLVQPKTRVPVAVQEVPYDAILSLERRRDGGMNGGKAAAIGVAAGVGTFFAALAILSAAFGD